MRIDILTIFPDYLTPLHQSLIGKAVADGIINLTIHDLRQWTTDNHQSVDDSPYGGGPGMVMRADIWGRALDDVVGGLPTRETTPAQKNDELSAAPDTGPNTGPTLLIPTPSGEPFTQKLAAELAQAAHLVVACGRYEGIDGRVATHAAESMQVREVSIGDYVLAGGEVAALVIIEAVGRLLPGVLGNDESARDDSFAQGAAGLLEGPVYTRPADFRGLLVPEILRSGDHQRVARFRRDESLRRTARYRPDLLRSSDPAQFDAADRALLTELGIDLS